MSRLVGMYCVIPTLEHSEKATLWRQLKDHGDKG
jgi:hypothetical protein